MELLIFPGVMDFFKDEALLDAVLSTLEPCFVVSAPGERFSGHTEFCSVSEGKGSRRAPGMSQEILAISAADTELEDIIWALCTL